MKVVAVCLAIAVGASGLRVQLRHLPEEQHLRYLAGLSQPERFQPQDDATSLLAPLLIPRPPGSANNTLVRRHLQQFMLGLNWTVEEDSFTATPPAGMASTVPIPFTNLVATMFPQSPRKLVISAHFDTLLSPSGFIGATDSAGPLAIMLDLALTLTPLLMPPTKDAASIPPLSLQFIFFDGEEALVKWQGDDNTYGARHLAAKWADTKSTVDADDDDLAARVDGAQSRLDQIDLMVLLDLLGSDTPWPAIPNYFADTAPVHDFVRRVEQRLAQLGLLSEARVHQADYFMAADPLRLDRYGVSDDHLPFKSRGVPILHVIPSPFPQCWHNHRAPDDASCLAPQVLDDIAKIFRVVIVEYLDADCRHLVETY